MLSNSGKMSKHLTLFVTLLFVAVAVSKSTDDKLKRVLANCDKTTPPSGNQTTIVKVGLYIMSIDLNDATREMTASMYFRQSWTESRLSGLGHVTVRLMDFDQIWLPDTFIRNDKKDELAPGKLSDNFRLLKVTHGIIWYLVKLTGRFSCTTRMTRYPKDAPVCEMIIESFGYTTNVMNLEFMASPVDIDPNMLMSAGIYLFDTEASDCSANYSAGEYPCLSIKFHFHRAAPVHMFTVVYLPSAVIVLVSTSSFWIQPDNPTPRLLVGLLTTLTVTLHAAAVRLYYVSTVTDLTLLDLWLIGCVLIVFVAFVLQLAGVVIAGQKAKKHWEASKVEAAVSENSGNEQLSCTVTDGVGKIAIPVLLVLLIIIYVVV